MPGVLAAFLRLSIKTHDQTNNVFDLLQHTHFSFCFVVVGVFCQYEKRVLESEDLNSRRDFLINDLCDYRHTTSPPCTMK